MKHKNVETVITYYHEIPEMVRLLKHERSELEGQYDGLGSVNMDGMPRGTSPGKPVEDMALRVAARGVWDRLQEIAVRLQVLGADAAAVRDCLDTMSGRYKRLLSMRYLYRYSWAKISVRLGAPDSTVRYWHKQAIDALGTALDDVPMIEELLDRASRARV